MLILITFLAFVSMLILVYLLLNTYIGTEGSIEMRLKALEERTHNRTDIDEELSKPFKQRIISPFTNDLAVSLMRVTPLAIRQMVEEKIIMAGGFAGIGTDGFLLLCSFLATALMLITVLLLIVTNAAINKIAGFAMIAFVVGLSLPFIILNQKITARKISMQRDLPDVLDLLTVSVEAGLGFDGALSKLSEKMKGALVEEFNRLLQEIRMGVSRREALVAMGMRCDVPDLSLFTTSLVQADQLGVSISNVLRVQSASMREKRKQRAEEKAMKAPIKMMLPLVMFIFPTIFIVLLGPAVIQIFETFTKR